MNGNPRPCIEAMKPFEYLQFLNEPRTCTKCFQLKRTGNFSITTERGKKVVRSRCKECLKAYYASVAHRRKKVGAKTFLSRPDQAAKSRAKRLKLIAAFYVHPHNEKFAVVRSFNGCNPRAIRIFETEQAAEAEALRLTAIFKE